MSNYFWVVVVGISLQVSIGVLFFTGIYIYGDTTPENT